MKIKKGLSKNCLPIAFVHLGFKTYKGIIDKRGEQKIWLIEDLSLRCFK